MIKKEYARKTKEDKPVYESVIATMDPAEERVSEAKGLLDWFEVNMT